MIERPGSTAITGTGMSRARRDRRRSRLGDRSAGTAWSTLGVVDAEAAAEVELGHRAIGEQLRVHVEQPGPRTQARSARMVATIKHIRRRANNSGKGRHKVSSGRRMHAAVDTEPHISAHARGDPPHSNTANLSTTLSERSRTPVSTSWSISARLLVSMESSSAPVDTAPARRRARRRCTRRGFSPASTSSGDLDAKKALPRRTPPSVRHAGEAEHEGVEIAMRSRACVVLVDDVQRRAVRGMQGGGRDARDVEGAGGGPGGVPRPDGRVERIRVGRLDEPVGCEGVGCHDDLTVSSERRE